MLAGALTHLSVLQQLHLFGNHIICFLFFCLRGDMGLRHALQGICCSHVAANRIGATGCSALAGALTHLSALQQLNLGGIDVLFFFCFVLRGDVGLRHALRSIS